MKININQLGVVKDDGYFRINITYGTHHFHSEKLNKESAMQLLYDLEEELT